MDAIELLKQQHRETETLFDRFEAAGSDEQKAEIATQVIADLRVHTTLQEFVLHHVEEEEDEMFPEARGALGEERLRELGVGARARTGPAAGELMDRRGWRA